MLLQTSIVLTSMAMAATAHAEPPDFDNGIRFRNPENLPLLQVHEPFAFIESEATVIETEDFGQMWSQQTSAHGFGELPLNMQIDDRQERSFNGIDIAHEVSLNARADTWLLRDGFYMLSKTSLNQNSSLQINEKEHDPYGWIINEGILSTYAWIKLDVEASLNNAAIVEFSGFATAEHDLMVMSNAFFAQVSQEPNGMISSRMYLPAGEYTFAQEVSGYVDWEGGIVSCKFQAHLPGDVNLDGYMDFDDILFFYYQCMGSDRLVSDMDNDGDTDSDDWLAILEIWRG